MPRQASAVPSRSRAVLVIALGGVIAAGLLSRRYPLPGVLAEHTGDALYTVAAFLAVALLLPRWSGTALATIAFGLSAAVELSQLLQFAWLDAIRATTPGRLLLGQGFVIADFAAYAIGALLAGAADRFATARPQRSASPPARRDQ